MQIKSNHSFPLTIKTIFLLWIPLAAMWLMMGIEMPLVNAVIARLAAAKNNLAAFGVTLAIALIVEAPVIQLLAAGTALADSRKNYRMLLTFTHLLAVSLTLLHLLIGLTPAYSLILRYVLSVPEDIIENSRMAFIWMFPWSAAVAYRRFWQGVLIRHRETKVVPLIMVIRMSFTTLILISGFFLPGLSGAEIGGLALSFGVTAGALASYLFVLPIVGKMEDPEDVNLLSWRKFIDFYFPLALTNFMTFIVRPILSFGIARAAFPLESLAVWPVVMSVLFLFRSTAMAFQEVAVALLKSKAEYTPLKQFAIILGTGLTSVLILIGLTPLGTLIYRHASGLTDDLLSFTMIPTLIVAVIPFVTSLVSFYRGVLIFKKKTGIIANAVLLNSIVLMVIILSAPSLFSVSGGVIAASAYMISMAAEAFYLKRKLSLEEADQPPGKIGNKGWNGESM